MYGFSDAVQFASAQSCQESGSEFSRGLYVCICMYVSLCVCVH